MGFWVYFEGEAKGFAPGLDVDGREQQESKCVA